MKGKWNTATRRYPLFRYPLTRYPLFRHVVICVALIACLVFPGPLHGDGGVLRLSEKSGNYRVTVFTPPGPLRAGPLEVNILVQDAATGVVLSEARVVVSAADRAIPERRIERPATAEAATNKLFHAANVDLPNPGLWEITIMIDGSRGEAASQFEVEVAEPKSRGASLWPWLSWPALVIIAFAVHQWRAAKLASPATTEKRR